MTTNCTTIADALYQARISRQPIAPLAGKFPALTIADAYKVSQINFQRRLAEAREHAVGKKIGLTSEAVQKQLGVSQPDYGFLTSDMYFASGAELAHEQFLQPKAEGEIAFIMRDNLRGPNVTVADVIRATESVAVAIEVIDSRVQDWKITINDTIADNASSAVFVISEQRCKYEDVDLRLAGMTLKVNGAVKSTGVGYACLKHPVNAVTWLANALAEFDEGISAGDIVLSGAFGPVVPVEKGDHFHVAINGVGEAEVRFS